jgi:hypothetical protein
MPRLTPEQIREPDVTLTISPAKWERLPQQIAYELEPYGNGYDGEGNFVITIPGYRWSEIESVMWRLK